MNKKTKIIFFIFIYVFSMILFFNNVFSMTHYQETDFVTGLVTANALNVREGPSTNYKIASVVYKNNYIRVFAKINDWYVIQTDSDIIGAVNSKYVKPIYPSNNANNSTNSTLSADEQEVFNLINVQRNNNGLNSLVIDEELQKVAKDKAQDMVDNSYFSHTSPTYGTPFEMIKNYNITYKTAGENIAGNSSNEGAVSAWMNSSGHKENILNNSFNYTGIGVVNSPKYGKIYVQLFIGK